MLLTVIVLGGFSGCGAKDPKLKLYAEPGKTVPPGETIYVHVGGNIKPDDIDWYREGNQVHECNNLAACEFTYDETIHINIKVVVTAKEKISEITGILQKQPSHEEETITLTWKNESTTTTTTTTTTTI